MLHHEILFLDRLCRLSRGLNSARRLLFRIIRAISGTRRHLKEKAQQLNTLAELSKQTNLPITMLRRALTSGSRLNTANILALANRANPDPVVPAPVSPARADASQASDIHRPITGKVVAIGGVEEIPSIV